MARMTGCDCLTSGSSVGAITGTISSGPRCPRVRSGSGLGRKAMARSYSSPRRWAELSSTRSFSSRLGNSALNPARRGTSQSSPTAREHDSVSRPWACRFRDLAPRLVSTSSAAATSWAYSAPIRVSTTPEAVRSNSSTPMSSSSRMIRRLMPLCVRPRMVAASEKLPHRATIWNAIRDFSGGIPSVSKSAASVAVDGIIFLPKPQERARDASRLQRRDR